MVTIGISLVLCFLWTYRYAKNPSLYAVELINEPLSPGVSLDIMTKYYRAGYNAVRKHSSTAYVIMSNRLGPADPKELFPLASGFTRSVIDVHYYNLYSDSFKRMSVQQNIDFVNTNRSAQLSQVTTSNGPLTFVGMYRNAFCFLCCNMDLEYCFAQRYQAPIYLHDFG